jgi:hypothetical protein
VFDLHQATTGAKTLLMRNTIRSAVTAIDAGQEIPENDEN